MNTYIESDRLKKTMINLQYYQNLERHFKTNYPIKNGATYVSPLNFSNDLGKSFQRWYRYKEGFSLSLVDSLINQYSKHEGGIILDPFLGSGTTIIGANLNNKKGAGFEVNPFTHFLASLKIKSLDIETIKLFGQRYKKLLDEDLESIDEYPLPDLSFAHKIFEPEVRQVFMKYRTLISKEKSEIRNYLMLGWLSILEEISNYRKAGNGLKIRRAKKKREIDVKKALFEKYKQIEEDLQAITKDYQNDIILGSCIKEIDEKYQSCSIEGAIFSPPYANCFDYTEIYTLELWFGEFVKSRKQLKELRAGALRSNLNNCTPSFIHNLDEVNYFINSMDNSIWDEKIPNMLRGYFDDMFTLLDKLINVLEKDGFCCIVVGNSTYGGVVVPTDLILAEYAELIGFKVDKIDVDRFIIPSSQQYNKTKDYSKYIRESVVCLVKKNTKE